MCNGVRHGELWTPILRCWKPIPFPIRTSADIARLLKLKHLQCYLDTDEAWPRRRCFERYSTPCAATCNNTGLERACRESGVQFVTTEIPIVYRNPYCAQCASQQPVAEKLYCVAQPLGGVPTPGPTWPLLFTFAPHSDQGIVFSDDGVRCAFGQTHIEGFGCRTVHCGWSRRFVDHDDDDVTESSCETVVCREPEVYMDEDEACRNCSAYEIYNPLGCIPSDNAVTASQLAQDIHVTESVTLHYVTVTSEYNSNITSNADDVTTYICSRVASSIRHASALVKNVNCHQTLQGNNHIITFTITIRYSHAMNQSREGETTLELSESCTESLFLELLQENRIVWYRVKGVLKKVPDCPYIVVNTTEVVMNENRQQSEPQSLESRGGDVIAPGLFAIIGDHVYICRSALNGNNNTRVSEDTDIDDLVLYIATVTAMGLSALSLFLRILLQFCGRPEYQTFPMSLQFHFCLNLFFFNLLFMFGTMAASDNRDACTVVAVLTYYTYLTSFVWMSVISVNIFLTFCVNKYSQNPTERGAKRMLRHCAVGWGVPLVVVVTAIGINWSDIDSTFQPHFGITTCWLSNNGYGILIFFAGPVFLSIALNAVMFILTANSLRTRFDSRKHITSSNVCHFKTYLTLFVMMGIGYALVIVTYFFDHIIVWIVLIVVNAGQGFYLGLVFVFCNNVLCTTRSRSAQ